MVSFRLYIKSVFGISSPNLKRPIYGYFSPFLSHVAPAMQLKKGKNYPKMISFLLSAENPEHALRVSFFENRNHYKYMKNNILNYLLIAIFSLMHGEIHGQFQYGRWIGASNCMEDTISKDGNLPLPEKELTDFVTQEILRFKMALLPAYRLLPDSLKKDSVWQRHFAINPLLPLVPHLRGYAYRPVYLINGLGGIRGPQDYRRMCYRNIYVFRKIDRFIREDTTVQPTLVERDFEYIRKEDIEQFEYDTLEEGLLHIVGMNIVKTNIYVVNHYSFYPYRNYKSLYLGPPREVLFPPDTIYSFDAQNCMPLNDEYFTVFYCKATNEKYMTGGNVFCEFPVDKLCEDYNNRGNKDIDRDRHATEDWIKIRAFHVDFDGISVMSPYTALHSDGMYRTDTINDLVLNKYNTYLGHARGPYLINVPQRRDNYNIEFIRYKTYEALYNEEKATAKSHQVADNYPMYKVCYRLKSGVLSSYDDILPIITGLTQKEVDDLIQKGFKDRLEGLKE
jgi:hypothetical protein